MKYFLVFALLAVPAWAEPDNSIIKACQAKHNYMGLNETSTWSDIATCIVTEKNKIRFAEEDRIWEFVKQNPRYRYPGQSLNRCFDKPKERALARLETKADGSTMAYYKDRIVECYF